MINFPLARATAVLAAVLTLATACSSSGGAGPSSGGSSSTSAAASAGQLAEIKVTGGHLTDATGRTIYLWVADKGSSSTCSGSCATVWPPVVTAGAPTAGSGAVAADLSTTTRSNGTIQVTYKGHPLYYFEGDMAPGAAVGQGSDSFGAKWWELTAAGSAITSMPTTPTSPAATSAASAAATSAASHPRTSSSAPRRKSSSSSTPKPVHSSSTSHPAPPTSSAPAPTSSSPSGGGGYGY